ncbi:uncharacterized protein EI90DRAFT_3116589 [Cantharellus anzutake]|uniref:uncharacterized protein n=1 Tax=Cantharellus anzutake TaxID=1750568 RepID=UPI0019051562|nr:uncharacterized protein EI90DRAFT_3116589 [Cantharellus anzutake]KAF8341472.1 hypothetical protein EI90DRAFT_3116589 [Cantharellus anzutake]
MAPRYSVLPRRDSFKLEVDERIVEYKAPRSPIIRLLSRTLLRYAACLASLLLLINYLLSCIPSAPLDSELWKTITEEKGTGGRWHIPKSWLLDAPSLPAGIAKTPKTSLEAAELAYTLATGQSQYMEYSSIPLIVHQTWKTMDHRLWSSGIIRAVGTWLSYCQPAPNSHGVKMAYILWDDDGIEAFMNKYEPDFLDIFWTLPSIVERTDVFRVLVLKWFGGIYGDVDTEPLRAPSSWIQGIDLKNWTDTKLHASYGAPPVRPVHPEPSRVPSPYDLPSKLAPSPSSASNPIHYSHSLKESTVLPSDPLVGAIFGIEADYPEESDAYWRAGYGFPTQLTNWALAMAPHHPIATRFQDTVREDVEEEEKEGTLMTAYAVDLTGPVMVTRVVSRWLADTAGLRWMAVTSLDFRSSAPPSKIVEDVLILPKSGFHPSASKIPFFRGFNDPAARLTHYAQGSWRKFNPHVEFGKFCRTFFGLCRDWGKEPPIIQQHHSSIDSASMTMKSQHHSSGVGPHSAAAQPTTSVAIAGRIAIDTGRL